MPYATHPPSPKAPAGSSLGLMGARGDLDASVAAVTTSESTPCCSSHWYAMPAG